MGAKSIVSIVGLGSLTFEQRRFIRGSGVSHKNPKAVQGLARLFKREFSGTQVVQETMRTILRQDQRRRRGTTGMNLEPNNPPVFFNTAARLQASRLHIEH